MCRAGAHHHVAHIGILGQDKGGQEYCQITLGGSADGHAAIGKILAPSVLHVPLPCRRRSDECLT